ncbi:MAG: Rpn family recombination-promoting nuclease/putative transposase [Candidatus Omnitrophota bacterium]
MTERNEDKGKTGQIVINNPHDKVVQKFLQEKETVQSFFNEYLPKEIKELLDMDSLEYIQDKVL